MKEFIYKAMLKRMKPLRSSTSNKSLSIKGCIACLIFTLILSVSSLDTTPHGQETSFQQITHDQGQEGSVEQITDHQRMLMQSQENKNNKVEKILWMYTLPQSFDFNQPQSPQTTQTPTNQIETQQKDQNSHSITPQQQHLFMQINTLNTKYFASKDNYTVLQIHHSNYLKYISKQNSLTIQTIINLLQNSNSNDSNQSSRTSKNRIKHQITRRLIIYYAILENGGVFIDPRATLLEPLDQWIQKLPSSPFLNPNTPPQNPNPYCLAFYNDSFSSIKSNLSPEQTINGSNFAVLFPNLQDYFLACGKGNPFLHKITQTYTQLLINGKNWEGFKQFQTDQKLIGQISPDLIFEHGHLISSHFVLQQQQKRLNANKASNQYAIESLSFYTINSRLGPQKLLNQFSIEDYKTYIYLMKLSVQELQLFIGPLRFLFVLTDQVAKYVAQQFFKYESQTVFVQKNSFFHHFWLKHVANNHKNNQQLSKVWKFIETYRVFRENPDSSEAKNQKLYELEQNQFPTYKRIILNQTKPQWKSLNKNIWIIWDNGVEGNSNLVVQLCYQNLKRSAQNSGFEINAVSKNKVHDFISNELLFKIEHAINNAAFDLGSQAISDLWRLTLIYEHGGVYFDASTFMMDQSFDWITKVTQFPENLIWNRYGAQPQVFMFWNAYYCNPVDWKWDRLNKVRAQWQLSLESNFIAAVKGSELIKEWLDTMLQWVTLPFDQIQKQMKNVGMWENRWTSDSFWHQGRYLTIMDAIKYVLGRREKLIQSQKDQKRYENSGDYYKVWSIPGQFLGQQKLRGETNYENRDYRLEKQSRQIDNVYKYQYPMKSIEKVLGPIEFQGKFFNWELIMMNKMLTDFYFSRKQNFVMEDLEQIIHPESVVALKLVNRYSNKTLELLKYYSQLSSMKLKVNGLNRIWSY